MKVLALAPKAPFIGYGGQFEGYEDKWKTANTNNWPYLEVNPDVTDGQGAVLPLPQRAQPPMASSGLLQAKAGASQNSLSPVTSGALTAAKKNIIVQNFDSTDSEVYVIVVRTITTAGNQTASVGAALQWREIY